MRVLQGVMFALAMICTLLVPVLGSFELVGQSIKDALAEYTLTDIMNNNQFAGIEFGEAEDGFPAFRFLQTADVKSPYRMLLPEKLYEFAILITFRQSSLKGGYLFSVVNPLDTVVQLGVHLSPVVKNSYNVSLVYTQADQNIGRKLASFGVAHVPDKWNSIALQVLSDKVSFYYDCELRNTTLVTREPIELVFDSASTLYIGQAGSIIGGKFEGYLEKINVYGNPDAINVTCMPPPKATIAPTTADDGSIFYEGSGENILFEDSTEANILSDDFWNTGDEATDIFDASGMQPPGQTQYTHERPYRGIKGEKGERGPKGDSIRGPPGPPGPPGPKGETAPYPPFVETTSAGAKYTGECTCNASDILEAIKDNESLRESLRGAPGGLVDGEEPYFSASSSNMNMKIVPGAVTFQNIDEMTKKSALNPPGTLAYITEEEALLVRVNKGWQYIALGTLVPIATPAPPTTVAPSMRFDLQSKNLLNSPPPLLNTPTFTTAPEYETWYPRMLRVAALNEPSTGDLQGIRGADFACYRQGRRAGLLGTFKAFLSSRVQNLDTIVRPADRDLPVVNTRGDVLFNSWKGIFNGQGGFFSQAPRIYSFSGKNVMTDSTWPMKMVWHGSLPNGERSMDTYCDAWHSGDHLKGSFASNLDGHKLLEQKRQSCDSKLIILCVEALSQDRKRKKREIGDGSSHGESESREFKTADEYAAHLENLLL
uniref:Multiplexin collagen isoform Ap2 n=1 Tax=Drosophila melanogaster TaxID=7227 RepID=G1API3_DROME|nr:multiplexin collagen isoform Ap2 [Drosophila melanogaster]